MAKKELRIYFNLDNENEKMLYEHLMTRTSASGYLKDIALDYLESKNKNHNIAEYSNIGIIEQLKNINKTLSNLSIVRSEVASTKSEESSQQSLNEISNIDINSLNIEEIDFSDIKL